MRSRIYAVLSIILFAILYCYTAVIVIIILILAWSHMKGPIRVISRFWGKSVFLIMGKKFSIFGKENISKDCRYILVANHASLFDIVAIMSFYSGVSWFGHERLLKVPLFGKILKMTDYVPFKEPTVKNTKLMLEQLVLKSKKHTVAIFPEGTRTLDGKINDFYKGFIYLFRTSDIGILPVTLNGFYKLKPKNRFYINFDSELSVVIHKPINREELVQKTDIEIIETVKTIIESAYK
ncbi:MAG: 1-acyl-sn-glycerol-3-phosphate acyltransferase [Bacteroidetes bacterium]|nr:MAG: 1-acyl-sn-glycerol-3-phosphate acyltransferase [Bacteroidota bacterium]